MMKILSIFALLFAWTTSALAQESGVYIDNLKSLRVEVNGAWDSEPVVNLGGRNWVEISFDDLQHTYVRYT